MIQRAVANLCLSELCHQCRCAHLEVLLECKIKIRMLVNRYSSQPEQVRRGLENLRKEFPAQLQLLSFLSQRNCMPES
jgi:hypothetical protein